MEASVGIGESTAIVAEVDEVISPSTVGSSCAMEDGGDVVPETATSVEVL